METNQFRQKYMLVFIRLSNYNYFFLGRYIRPFLYPCPCSRPSIPIHVHPCPSMSMPISIHSHPCPCPPMLGHNCIWPRAGCRAAQHAARAERRRTGAATQGTVVPLPFCPALAVCRRVYYYWPTFSECVFWNVRSYGMGLVERVQSL